MSKIFGLAKDESGMAMGLAIITMVLIGVMGAGLLTFVVTDLNAVVSVNQGQRAFEMADAGVQAAERQLVSDSTADHYDGGTGDIQWSSSMANASCGDAGATGMCLNDLDSNATTTDRVNIAIQSAGTNAFRVVSTGQYGEAKRKVEAVYKATATSGTSGIPAYYTPGTIKFKKDATIDVSMFAGGNIRVGKDSLVGLATKDDPLGDWNRPPYNTVARKDASGVLPLPYTKTGLAAEVYICKSTGTCSGSGDSIADGVIGYDSTTGPTSKGGRGMGNKKKFVEKLPPTGTQDTDTITYPFPRVPNVDGLLARAKSGSPNVYDDTSPYDIPTSTTKMVHFIDAKESTVNLDKTFTFKGVLVIRCGNLELDKGPTIEGIVMVVKGTGAGCASTGKVNIKKDAVINGYVFAESESETAIDIDKDAKISPPPPEYGEYLSLAYSGDTQVTLQSWRELYQ